MSNSNTALSQDNDKEKHSKRFIEICTKHTESTADDSDQSDRYEDDEIEGLPKVSGFDYGLLGMRFASAPKPPREPEPGKEPRAPPHPFAEPDYDVVGGVCWKLLTTLKSRTRFTNSEIRKEGKRSAGYFTVDF